MEIWHGHNKGRVEVKLDLDLTPELSLRIICNGIQTTDALVEFLKMRRGQNSDSAEGFVDSFLASITGALNLQDLQLEAKPEEAGGPLDFWRPSPSWLMLKRFIEGLAEDEGYRRIIERYSDALPHYINIRWRSSQRRST